MRRFLPLALLVIGAVGTIAETPESNELEEFVREYETAWQSHDGGKLAGFFAEDADMILGIEPRIVGREAIATWWDLYFSRLDRGRRLSISLESVRVLSPDVALLNVGTTTEGTHSTTREVLEPRRARGTWVVTRSSGGWSIAALRAHSPVGEPREAPGRDD
jgi:uncharacterized protein (TIGR02246 family)